MAFLLTFGGEYRRGWLRRKAGLAAVRAIQPSPVRSGGQGRTAGDSSGKPFARDIR
jgi:hypothetical protein